MADVRHTGVQLTAIAKDSETLDLSSDTTSNVYDVLAYTAGAIEVDYTGLDASDGEFQLQGRNTTTADWKPINNGDVIAVNASDDILYDIAFSGYRYISVAWTANSVTAGTASLTATWKKG